MARTYRLSRSSGLKIQKIVKSDIGKPNSVLDLFAVQHGTAMARDKRFNPEKELAKAAAKDAEWEQISKIPTDSSDLMVITKAKQLGQYIVAITQKSPARFRSVFVNRMHNLCLDALQNMLRANFIHADCAENKKRREQYQIDAIIDLKILGYIAYQSECTGCILRRQYKQVSILLGDVINMATAWRKSDNNKWGDKISQPKI